MAGNDRFEISCTAQMLPALLHGLAIARNTAMMCGGPGVRREFDAMLEDLARQCGIPNLLRVVDEYKWYRACDAMRKAKEFHWYIKDGDLDWGSPDRSRKPGSVSLVVDGREYPLEHSLSEAEPHLAAIREMVEMYAPVEAARKPDERGWRACRDVLAARQAEAAAAAGAHGDDPDGEDHEDDAPRP